MAETLVSNVIKPEVFLPYVIERTATLSEFISSGIVAPGPEFVALANGGGNTVQMPFWKDLTGADEVISDSTPLATGNITADKDIAAVHNRGKGWATNDLAAYISGDDPMGAIGDLVAAYWARRIQAFCLSSLKGLFGAASMSANLAAIHNTSGAITDAQRLNGSTFIDAKQKLGDAKEKLVAIAMHSAVESSLLKLDLIDFVPDSEGKQTIKTFQGLRVIIDDGMPTSTVNSNTVYDTYLFGRGAFAEGVSTVDKVAEAGIGTWQLEFARKADAGTNQMFNRRRFILHPRGVKWASASVAGQSPTNAELEDQSNWVRVYEAKNVRIVKVTHNV